MCVKDLVLELERIMDKIEKANEEIKNEKSRIDLLREDLLHFIENDTFNASQGYKYAKALQKIQNERRTINTEFHTLQGLTARLKPIRKAIKCTTKKVNKFENLMELGMDAYSPRILKSASGDDILNKVINILNEDE